MGGMIAMAVESPFGATGGVIERAAPASAVREERLSWPVSVLFILGVSLIAWGTIVMAVRALLG